MNQILLFGIAKDILGGSTYSLDLKASKIHSVGELRTHLYESHPELRRLNSLAIAVNEHYALDDVKIIESDEIALIPPVSGG